MNGDGAISRAELGHKLRVDTELQMMMEVAGKMPAYVFEQLDGDGDGSITLEEFVCLVEPDDADEDYDPDEEEEPEGESINRLDDDDERRPGHGEQETGELAALEQELVELQREAESLGLEENVGKSQSCMVSDQKGGPAAEADERRQQRLQELSAAQPPTDGDVAAIRAVSPVRTQQHAQTMRANVWCKRM